MYLWVPLYKYKLYSTYGYLYIIISSITPTRELNKYKYAISTSISSVVLAGTSISISSVTPTRDLNKYKSAISTSISFVVLTGTSVQV